MSDAATDDAKGNQISALVKLLRLGTYLSQTQMGETLRIPYANAKNLISRVERGAACLRPDVVSILAHLCGAKSEEELLALGYDKALANFKGNLPESLRGLNPPKRRAGPVEPVDRAGGLIRGIRLSIGLSQGQFGGLLGVSHTLVSHIELGAKPIFENLRNRLAYILDVRSFDDLLAMSDEQILLAAKERIPKHLANAPRDDSLPPSLSHGLRRHQDEREYFAQLLEGFETRQLKLLGTILDFMRKNPFASIAPAKEIPGAKLLIPGSVEKKTDGEKVGRLPGR